MRTRGPVDSNGMKKNKRPSHLKYNVIDKSHALFDRLFAATAAKLAAVKMTRTKSYRFQKSLKYLILRKRERQVLCVANWRADATTWYAI